MVFAWSNGIKVDFRKGDHKMEGLTNSQQKYEKELVYHLLIFLKAMEQYRIWGRRAFASDVLRSDPQFEQGMRLLLQAMNICGECFRTLPKPPEGGIEADTLIRSLGQEVSLFTECLEALLLTTDPVKRETLLAALSAKSKEIKQGYRQFAALYDLAFPGRLSLVLQSLREGVSPEMQ